jgi:Mce-associated membrane protein
LRWGKKSKTAATPDVFDTARGDSPTGSEGTTTVDGQRTTRFSVLPALALAVVPAVALFLTAGAAWLKWQLGADDETRVAAAESVRTASEVTAALLSYNPATADSDLRAARDQLTGTFRDAYSSLIDDVVIPGAKQKQIFSTAVVPAASLVSATRTRAVVLVFVDQSTIVGSGAPTETGSSVRVTLDKIHGRWLISDFVPIQ